MKINKKGKILIVDDDKDVLHISKLILENDYSVVETESNPNKVFQLVRTTDWDVVVLDMNFAKGETSGVEGLKLLKSLQKARPEIHVLMMTAYGDIELAVEAMKLGATDFIVKPWDKEKFQASVRAVADLSRSKKQIKNLKYKQNALRNELETEFSTIVSKSEIMQNVYNTINKIATSDANVLILGENGTGKELIAREIHKQSTRNNEPFIKVDLGAIPETLFESELFGHTKGAFTDAKSDRPGKFEIASGGTLFLDEIGNIPLALQSKILSVLQNRLISRLGSNKELETDFRLICATNMPLNEMVNKNEFRQDLYFRINTVEITVPALRERLEDIEPLCVHFLSRYKRKYNKFNLSFGKNTMISLTKYHWPGNVRELMHAMERAVLMCDTNKLQPDDFLFSYSKNNQYSKINKPDSGEINIEEMEKQTIQKALHKWKGNYTKAAKDLGWGRSTLYRKRLKYGL